MSLSAPAAVRSALRKGLVLVRDGYAGKGLRGKTVEWAERLANGEPIDYAKAKKMRGWFARHGVAKAESAKRLRDPKSPAAVAYLLWGGTPSIPFRKAGWQDPVAPWLRDVLAKFEEFARANKRSARKNGGLRRASERDRTMAFSGLKPQPRRVFSAAEKADIDAMNDRFARHRKRLAELAAPAFKAMSRSGYKHVGLRMVDDPAEARVGVTLRPSRHWDHGAITNLILPGTSVIAWGEPSEMLAYGGRYLLVVGSDRSAGRGDDRGEKLLVDARVVASFDLGE